MPVIYLEKSVVDNISEDFIKKIIEKNTADPKYDTLKKYYIGEHKILSEKKSDSSAPDNKIVANMAKYITDTAVGYFLGLPVVYSSENEQYMQKLQDVLDYNDEQDENVEIAKNCSIYGSCFEMIYFDEEANIRFAKVNPVDLIMIYQTGTTTPIAAIRTAVVKDVEDKTIKYVDFYNWEEIWRLKAEGDSALSVVGVEENVLNDIPFIEYINNEERIGDFEGVVSIIDAYNKAQSNSANMFQYNDEAILKVLKMGDVTAKDIADMKEQGAVLLEDGGDIQWLLKTIDDTALENHKRRLREDMHTFSSVPNLNDEAFGGNLSGIAMSYKLWGLEQICGIKERKFKKGLQRRIELMSRALMFRGGTYDYRDIKMQFRRNKPQNILEIAQIMQMLATDLSRESRLQMLPIVEDVQAELKKLTEEQNAEVQTFGSYNSIATPPSVAIVM